MYIWNDMERRRVPDDGRLLLITYGKFDEWYKPDEVTFEDLWEMGWDGDISKWRDAKMYDFNSGQLIKREEYED